MQIQNWSDVPPRQPLFESILVFENYPVHTSSWGQNEILEISNSRSFERTNYPITAVMVPGPELKLLIT